MVTAIRTINPETKRELVNIKFDSKLRLKPKTRICKNEQEADEFIERNYAILIRDVLVKFAKQEQYILNKYPSAKGAAIKLNAAAVILNEMEYHHSSPLVVIASSVYWLKACIYNLAPSPQSRYRAHYDEIISPLVDWCFYYSKKQRAKLLVQEHSKIQQRD